MQCQESILFGWHRKGCRNFATSKNLPNFIPRQFARAFRTIQNLPVDKQQAFSLSERVSGDKTAERFL